ncbi:unnamed protein product [Arctia plantaginis]|uniref:Uncharacterized protein n=1 Tax=Arctia plantaginis TaxID=874455 RepID=A0A8S0ZPA0_ARCPL|nr:unnamed protein product [Arctia plantaginis]CAB3234891.1 unnamed protein product [Arctia plantaginis]
MSGLLYCGICCMLISAWGIIQLTILGSMFYFEVPILFEEVEAEDYDDYDDFIKKTKENYLAVAINCWIAAVVYIVTLALSCLCIMKAKRTAAREAKLLEDDEYVCTMREPKVQKKKRKVVD